MQNTLRESKGRVAIGNADVIYNSLYDLLVQCINFSKICMLTLASVQFSTCDFCVLKLQELDGRRKLEGDSSFFTEKSCSRLLCKLPTRTLNFTVLFKQRTIRQGSASASKNYYGCFWKSAIASAVHAKKQKLFQKLGLHETLAKILLKFAAMASWLQSDSRSKGVVDHVIMQAHAARDSFSNFFFSILVYFIIIRYS